MEHRKIYKNLFDETGRITLLGRTTCRGMIILNASIRSGVENCALDSSGSDSGGAK